KDEVNPDTLKGLLEVDKAVWKAEAKGIEEFFTKFGDRLPKELTRELKKLKSNLRKA
ncbi:MAG: phosphoenolpyruvate carboxykinase domain-containing protein, partial [Clostridia bacterium]|nr:phosphoenolpyruvate carboxykinase domain-containing protein [Clostridia bacterium]